MSEEFPCQHKSVRLVRWNSSNGAQHASQCCLRCGKQIVSFKKGEVDLQSIPFLDRAKVQEQYHAAYAAHYDRQKLDRERRFWQAYEAHVGRMSPKWRSLRARVFRRCGGVCEGCGVSPATEVHHLTYERLGDEMLFDLVGVCSACHDKIHPHRSE